MSCCWKGFPYVVPHNKGINALQKSPKRYLIIYANLHGEKPKLMKPISPECTENIISHEGKDDGHIPTSWLSSLLTCNALGLLTLTQFEFCLLLMAIDFRTEGSWALTLLIPTVWL